MRRLVPTALKRLIGESPLFWRYRHLLSGDAVWRGYAEDWASPRRGIYPDLCRRFGLRSVFEFGCASGTNLLRIEHDIPEARFYFLGVDISTSAVTHARRNVRSPAEFHTSLTRATLVDFLRRHDLSAFDLAIYDRVLYILTEAQLHDHLVAASWAFRYIVVDDFFPASGVMAPAWSTKDYPVIFRQHGFDLLEVVPSEHHRTQAFHVQSARRAIFVRADGAPPHPLSVTA